MYQEASKLLQNAKASGEKSFIVESLLTFVIRLEKACKGSVTPQTLAEFVLDNDYLLPTDSISYSKTKADLHVTSDGIVSSLLDVIGINGNKVLAVEIKNKIFTAHASVSSGGDNAKADIQGLITALQNLRSLIQNS
jgi:hypothetical protein